jgi:ABC-type nitrate/sulfonate/bicarbonate transport system substrate-binding protein
MMNRALLLLLLVGFSLAQTSSLRVAYTRDSRCAPLYAAAAYPKDFRSMYGLYLSPTRPGEQYDLYDGSRVVLSVRLAALDSDSAVLNQLLGGGAQVGILNSEDILQAVIDGRPVKVVAPLQFRGDMLLVSRTVPAIDWPGFLRWAKGLGRPAYVGYVGRASMTVLGFEQALDYESIKHARDTVGTTATVVLLRYDTWQATATDLGLGRIDAAILAEPGASAAAATGANRIVERIDILPPGRFEDRPGAVVASTVPAIADRSGDIGRFLELMAVATHYANNRTRSTLAATAAWLKTQPAAESASLAHMTFSSLPDFPFEDGIWNWYFALRLARQLPDTLSNFMEKKDWLGIPYDSSLVKPALERAGARIVR